MVDWLGGANVEDQTWRCVWACGPGSHIEIELFASLDNKILKGPYTSWYDKVKGKTVDWNEDQWKEAGYRHVPNGTVREGSFIGKGVVLMPSFVNIGAYIDEGTMVDTWATVGSCAQIGKNCHLSGGVGIGGVLEPLQANPVIIEDNCFVGA